jgi:hypothetical protein
MAPPPAPPAVAHAARAALAAVESSEHVVIGSDDAYRDPSSCARTVSNRFALENSVRRSALELILYAEGFLDVVVRRGDKQSTGAARYRLDLRYLDPVPSIERAIATRSLWAAVGSGGLAAAAAGVATLGVAPIAMLATAGVATAAALGALWLAIYRSHETTAFVTIHGRVRVLELVGSLGSIRAARALVPELSRAIEAAAETIGDDTAAYLRAEMREHYRLRDDGVLSANTCSDGTGRILVQFEMPL